MSKNYCWVWIAVDRLEKWFVTFVCGDRSGKAGLMLWDKTKDMNVNCYFSDYCKYYEYFISKEKHLQTKTETYIVEGYNSRMRHYLARFKRKEKCYSKTE